MGYSLAADSIDYRDSVEQGAVKQEWLDKLAITLSGKVRLAPDLRGDLR